ncbi:MULTISPECIES: hypothetical protein [unclassified Sphingopyxis]|uniref:hypothetical protein n=1 Tax=unclassified Sphingopyxis TaxID=2614943 RepID=UPI002867811A|nr:MULTISPECIES: hypothetical protein [unclassified Sphingopyxis]MDR7061197.1 hypothetical protein [Sphingopyxis sp. BE235]MDR7182072.1 hypothetical protein [Sphingopyxis sp. BE249]
MNILAKIHSIGLRAITYTNKTTEPDENGSRYWIPRDCVATNGKAGIFYRISEGGRRDVPGATYDFDGWEPWADGAFGTMFGGRYQTFEQAIGWLTDSRFGNLQPVEAENEKAA